MIRYLLALAAALVLAAGVGVIAAMGGSPHPVRSAVIEFVLASLAFVWGARNWRGDRDA